MLSRMLETPIGRDYLKAFPKSADLARRAGHLFPSGVTHDGRYHEPFPVFVDRAEGARKTTVEGRPLVDYWMGHGSLILGHSHPDVVRAVQEQAARGTHYSACHPLEVQWADLVQKLVPSSQRIRFTNSGTEATLMALRVARIATNRAKVVKLAGHFHGWHDALVPAAYAPYDFADWSMPGVRPGNLEDLIVLPPNRLDLVEEAFAAHRPACMILEPTGGHWGTVPLSGAYLRGLRELCTAHGVVLIFDEVITGFRVHPGGAQSHYAVLPDLTTLAKILAGGLPGGALVGKAELMEVLAFENRYGKKMKHPGTYNGNPLSAAAGVATLYRLAMDDACATANAMAQRLRDGLNRLFARKGVDWVAYGEFSTIRVLPGYDGPRPEGSSAGFVPCDNDLHRLDRVQQAELSFAFRSALLLGGVDWFGWGGLTSAAHTPEIIDETIAGFDHALDLLSAVTAARAEPRRDGA